MQDNTYKILSSILYGGALISMYSASTLYHISQEPKIKRFFKIFDHSAIYLLIAGTYTPFTLVSLRGDWGWTLFGIVWGFAIFGILFKFFFIQRFEIFSTVLYLAMGWLAVIAIKPFWDALPGGAIVWLVLGGLAYTVGVFFSVGKNFRLAIPSGIYLYWPAALFIFLPCCFMSY